MLKVKSITSRRTNTVEEVEIDGLQQEVEFTLFNGNGDPQKCRLVIGYDTAWLGIEGYGSCIDNDEKGVVTAIDVYHKDAKNPYLGRKDAQVLVWSNINNEEPIFVVKLDGARLEKRIE